MQVSIIQVLVFSLTVASMACADNLTPGGTLTRFWDCCKPSGSNAGKASVTKPVATCGKDGVAVLSASTQSACVGGSAYACYNQAPFVSGSNPSLSYAFGARGSSNGEANFECACYAITTNQLGAKTLVVQAISTGDDVYPNNFDIQIPGGGVGQFNACSAQWGLSTSQLGAQYGGFSSRSQCDQLPSALRAGCQWRFDWWADNPTIKSIKRVACPAALTSKSGCIRTDDGSYPAAPQ